jgi:hypothetical protein
VPDLLLQGDALMSFAKFFIFGMFALVTTQNASADVSSNAIDPRASALCKSGYSYVGDQITCLKKLEGLRFEDEAFKVCSNYSYVGDNLTCLNKLSNLNFQPDFVTICAKYSYVGDRQTCLLNNSSPMPKIPSDNSSNVSNDVKTNVNYDLNLALRALHSGDLANTESLIQAALKALNPSTR